MKLNISKNKKRIIFTSVILIIFLIIKKIFNFASAPTKEKECDFIFPNNVDHTKSTSTASFATSSLSLTQKNGVINDASCLNKTGIFGIAHIQSEDDIKNALQFARDNNLKVTPAGERHSMGGQSFIRRGLVLNMKQFNRIEIDKEHKIVQVQSGATWEQIQHALDKEGLAVKAMQSINIFTVGGTLSVNAHGIAHDPGSVAGTVESMRVMLANGEIKTASKTENPELFTHVLGGYGLFGIILDVKLHVVENEMYEWNTEYIDYTNFPEFYKQHIKNNNDVGLTYARLSVSPHSYLKETAVHTYKKIKFEEQLPELKKDEHTALQRFVINFSKTGSFGRWVRWMLEKYVEPHTHICSRNQAMSAKEVCLVSRNQEMYDAMGYLKNNLRDTDILQEYFVPQEKMPEFVDGLRGIVNKYDANLLNVTIRMLSKDTITALPYAKEDMFAFVLYTNQKLNERDSGIVKNMTVDLIDLTERLEGTFYLPYQLHYSPEQLRGVYPEVDAFFETKQKYDPGELFVNTWYEKYKK